VFFGFSIMWDIEKTTWVGLSGDDEVNGVEIDEGRRSTGEFRRKRKGKLAVSETAVVF